MPLSIAVSIMMMTVFTTAILAWIILGDALTACEIFTILMGTFGMFMFCSANVFAGDSDEAMHEREAADAEAYPYYSIGIVVAVSVTFWMAFEFIAMSNLGGFVHSSWKTFTLGFLSTVLSLIYLIFVDIKFFYGWAVGDSPITWPQVMWSVIIGIFSWACLESKSLALSTVKSGTVTCFTNLSLVVSFATDVLWF